MQENDYHQAMAAFERAVLCGADVRKAQIGEGMAAFGLGKGERAWEIFIQVLDRYPDDQDALNWLIRAGTLLERWEGLGQRLSGYVERNPADCDMRFALAGVEFRAGQLDSAMRQFEMLSLLKPDCEGLDDLGNLLQMATLDRHALAT
jgi:thioredoxin-like negative regulator of GroEL